MKIKFIRQAAPCTHIRVEDTKGNLLFVTDEATLQTTPVPGDDPILVRLKHEVMNTDTSLGLSFTAVKTTVELKEF